MKARAILTLVSGALQDQEPGLERRWPWTAGECGQAGLVDFMNAAIGDIVGQCPELGAITESIRLEPGMRQWLPQKRRHCAKADAFMLFELVRNMGSDGNTPGEGIISVQGDILLAFGRAGKCGKAVENYAYDRAMDQRTYLVYPPVPEYGDVWVEASYAAMPAPICGPDEDIPIPESYAGVISHHMLAAILSGDNESGNYQKAVYHAQVYNSLMGIRSGVDLGWPKAKTSGGGQWA